MQLTSGGAPPGPVTLTALALPSSETSKSNSTRSPSFKLRKPSAFILVYTDRKMLLAVPAP